MNTKSCAVVFACLLFCIPATHACPNDPTAPTHLHCKGESRRPHSPRNPLSNSSGESTDYLELTKRWYENGVEKSDSKLVMAMIAEDVQWWCFGPPGFTLNDYYSGKTGPQGVGLFFQRLAIELGPDTPGIFQIRQFDVQSNIVTVYGTEVRPTTPFMRSNAPGLRGEISYNYFTHRLEFDLTGRIHRFRCNWSLSDTPAAVSPF